MASSSSPSPPSGPPEAESSQTQKLATAPSRFKSLTGAFSSKKPKDTVVFPPPSWFITDEEIAPNNVEVEPTEAIGGAVAPEQPEAPEPLTLAQRIKTLIDSLPLPAAFAPASTHDEGGTNTKLGGPALDESAAIPKVDEGPPVPTGVDARLMRLLSSEDVMNGDAGNRRREETRRESVWSMLERLRHGQSASGNKANSDDTNGAGVMLYSPLEPKSDSQVELAESGLEYIDAEDFRSGKFVDEDEDKGKERETAPPSVPVQPVLEKHWVPSTTKLSLYTTWWGYRLYLPPPVMATLGDNQLKATKRAAMITAALQWFLNKIPLMMMPPQVRGTVALLRRLLPLVGYIGVFIAWSWTRIATCNKGDGVVLTATWLLPVALIPMAWDAGAIHGPSIPPPSQEEEPAAKRNNTADPEENKKNGSKSKKSRK